MLEPCSAVNSISWLLIPGSVRSLQKPRANTVYTESLQTCGLQVLTRLHYENNIFPLILPVCLTLL